MKQPREKDSHAHHRATRWDLIKKRHLNNTTVAALKTDAVKRFIEMDFVGPKQRERLLCDGAQTGPPLNPLVVMDLRHEVFKKSPKPLPLATVQRQQADAWCKEHNIVVEQHYIANELNQLRKQLDKQRKRNSVPTQPSAQSLQINNERLVESLRKTSQHIEDFYMAPLQAFEEAQRLFSAARNKQFLKKNEIIRNEQEKEKSTSATEILNRKTTKVTNDEKSEEKEEEVEEVDISGEIFECIEEIEQCENFERKLTQNCPDSEHAENDMHVRCVRFDEDVEIRKYTLRRENSASSHTSDDIDSVISDLAEEALLELRLEEEEARKSQASTATEDVESVPKAEKERAELTQTEIKANGDNFSTASLTVRRLELPPAKNSNSDNQQSMQRLSSEEEEEGDEDDSISNHEQSKIIEQLFQSRAHTNIVILRKYFLQWIHYTNIEKIGRENMSCKNDRIHKINMFLDKVRKEKVRQSKITIRDANSTQHDDEERIEHVEKQKVVPGTARITKKYQNK